MDKTCSDDSAELMNSILPFRGSPTSQLLVDNDSGIYLRYPETGIYAIVIGLYFSKCSYLIFKCIWHEKM